MAVATTAAIAAGASLLSAGSSAIKAGKANRAAEGVEQQIADFQRQDLTNPYENLTINTTAADQQTDAQLSSSATAIDALQRGGTRAVLAGIPRINENNILLQEIISRDIANQEQQRDLMIARGDENIQRIQERREEMALQGLGQQMQTYRQDAQTYSNNAVQSGLSFASAFGGSFGSGQGATSAPTVPNGANVNQNVFSASRINPLTGLPY